MTRHLALIGFVFCAPAMAAAQIDTGILEKHKAALEKQTTDPDQKRDGGTQPRDWDYQLPEGVRTRQVTFYVDGGTPLIRIVLQVVPSNRQKSSATSTRRASVLVPPPET